MDGLEQKNRACPNTECTAYKQIYSTFRYCSDCGTKMQAVKRDCECGTERIVTGAFCTECGRPRPEARFIEE